MWSCTDSELRVIGGNLALAGVDCAQDKIWIARCPARAACQASKLFPHVADRAFAQIADIGVIGMVSHK